MIMIEKIKNYDKKLDGLISCNKNVIDKVLIRAFYTYLFVGLCILIGIVLFSEVSKNIGPLAILLASQIAGLAVVRTIINSNETERNKEKNERIKSQKVLNSYLRHLIVLCDTQVNYFNDLIKTVTANSNYTLEQMKVHETFYSDEVNKAAFINPIEAMLNHDLHKYTDEEIIDFILETKAKILELLHTMKLIKSIYVPNNAKGEFLDLCNTVKSDINNIKNKANNLLNIDSE